MFSFFLSHFLLQFSEWDDSLGGILKGFKLGKVGCLFLISNTTMCSICFGIFFYLNIDF